MKNRKTNQVPKLLLCWSAWKCSLKSLKYLSFGPLRKSYLRSTLLLSQRGSPSCFYALMNDVNHVLFFLIKQILYCILFIFHQQLITTWNTTILLLSYTPTIIVLLYDYFNYMLMQLCRLSFAGYLLLLNKPFVCGSFLNS